MNKMNELEKALTNPNNADLDFYLEVTPTEGVRLDIEEIKRKAANEKDSTSKIQAIRDILFRQFVTSSMGNEYQKEK